MFLTLRSAMSDGGPGPLAAILPFLSFLLTIAVSLGYTLWFWANKGATPGKKMIGLRIIREDGEEPLGWGTAFMRLVGYMVSGFILCIGFLMIAFNPDKMGLHDKIAKTRVLKIRSPLSTSPLTAEGRARGPGLLPSGIVTELQLSSCRASPGSGRGRGRPRRGRASARGRRSRGPARRPSSRGR